jgi:glutamine amidotransferase
MNYVMHSTDFNPTGIQIPSKQSPVSVAIIDYGLGNVRSVANALQVLGAEVKISRNPQDFQEADGLILPGVGAFGDGMANLKQFGLIPHLNEMVLEQKKPFLGICLGMQLLAKTSTEGGLQEGLGWLDADVIRLGIQEENFSLKIPHVGWNDVTVRRTCPVLGLPGENKSFYFVHSYALHCHEPEIVTGTCEYGIEFPVVIQKNNILAVQFHPEKSQKHGLNLLANFLNMTRNKTLPNFSPQSTQNRQKSSEAAC